MWVVIHHSTNSEQLSLIQSQARNEKRKASTVLHTNPCGMILLYVIIVVQLQTAITVIKHNIPFAD